MTDIVPLTVLEHQLESIVHGGIYWHDLLPVRENFPCLIIFEKIFHTLALWRSAKYNAAAVCRSRNLCST